MRNIIIVECRSTGINFIEDIINRGYKPVVLEVNYGDSETGIEYKEAVHKEYNEIKHHFDLIYEKDTYEETLEEVRKWNPLLILPGNEKGVVLASKLSNDLNLKCNPIENLDAMTLKSEMQKRIAEHGLRSIRGKVVRTAEEAIEYYETENLKNVVLKPIYGASSAGIEMCSTKEEITEYMNKLTSKTNSFGEHLHEAIIQERIDGDEYIVNTVSCEGKHRVTLIWKYTKIRTPEGNILYEACETVDELDISEAEMVEYAYSVADAMGIQYGPVHGEYMIDEKGPVLIEVNCRPCGGHMYTEFLDEISGQHETDSILDSYLKPEYFNNQMKQPYKLFAHGALKFFNTPHEILAVASPIKNINIKLKSHYSTMLEVTDNQIFIKTEDLESGCGITFLVNKDYRQLKKDLTFLRHVEKYAFSLILTEKRDTDKNYVSNTEEIIEGLYDYGTGLIITDEPINTDLMQVSPKNLDDTGNQFDFIIFNLNNSLKENDIESLITLLSKSFKKVKTGGVIHIPESTYDIFPNGRRGMEALIKACNFKIEVPPYNIKNSIIASKK